LEILLAFIALGAGVWYWQDSLRSRELVLQQCRKVCEQNGVQLLDQSVHVAQVRLGRVLSGPAAGKICIRRFYAFEFSVGGVDRYHGVAVMANFKFEYLSLLHPQGEIIEGKLPTGS